MIYVVRYCVCMLHLPPPYTIHILYQTTHTITIIGTRDEHCGQLSADMKIVLGISETPFGGCSKHPIFANIAYFQTIL